MKQQNKITAWLLGAFCLCTAAALTSCRNEADMDPFITASEADIVLQADGLTEQGQPGEFELAANQSWKLIDKPQWVVLNHEEGLRGRHKIYVSAQANTTGEDREGYLELELSNGKPEQVAVFQHRLAEKISIDNKKFSVNLLGKTDKNVAPAITINTNYAWTLTPADGSEWIIPSATEGKPGTANVTLQVKPNDAKADRTGTLLFKAGQTEISITVSQNAIAFNLPIHTLSLSRNGKETISGEAPILPVNALEGWQIISQPEWIKCTPAMGKAGLTNMTINATENTTGLREGKIALRSEHGIEASILIQQDNKATLKPDDRAVGHVYFAEPFDWARQIAQAYPDKCQDQVGSINGSAGNTVSIYSYPEAKALFDNTLEDYRPKQKCLYVANGYLKMGRYNKQTGVTLKPALDIPEGRMANVEVSIDIAVNGQDPTAIVVEISGDGQIADGVSATMSKDIMPIKNTDVTKPWQWLRNQKVVINGVTANTRITIRPRQMDVNGYFRWFLDNIKVTRITTNK